MSGVFGGKPEPVRTQRPAAQPKRQAKDTLLGSRSSTRRRSTILTNPFGADQSSPGNTVLLGG